MWPGDNVYRDELADAPGGGRPGISGGLDGADIAPDQHSDVASADVFRANQHHIRGFDHRVGCLNGANEPAGFHHPERIALGFHLVDRDDIMLLHCMQRRVWSTRLLSSLGAMALLCVAAASCSEGSDTSPAVASIEVALSKPKAPLGSPIEVTYRIRVANDAPSFGTETVFVHFVDADEELMWTDDHEPPIPTNQWKPGQTVEYTRTIFVPIYPYVGRAKVFAGLYDTSTKDRLKLSQPDRGDRSYQVAELELLPQTENVFLIFKDGWHPAEVAANNPAIEWQWTKREATLAFRNPKRDSTLFLQLDNPGHAPGAATQVEIRIGDQVIATEPVVPTNAPVRKIPLTAAQLGTGDMVEVRLIANSTFVPTLEPGAKSNDTRELGVRVFHAFVQPAT
jgi:hypothetical protein